MKNFLRSPSGDSVDVLANAREMCRSLYALGKSLNMAHVVMIDNLSYIRARNRLTLEASEPEDQDSEMVVRPSEDQWSGLAEDLAEFNYDLQTLAESLRDLHKGMMKDMVEDYAKLEYREDGVERVYQYRLEVVRAACPSADDLEKISSALTQASESLPDLDLSAKASLQVVLDGVRGLPDDLRF